MSRIVRVAFLLAAALLLLAGPVFAQEAAGAAAGDSSAPVSYQFEGEGGLWQLSPHNLQGRSDDGGENYGAHVDNLYKVILWLITGTFVLTEGLLLFFLFVYRKKPGGRAKYTHGNHKLEVIWTIIPGAILFWLAIYQVGTWKEVKIDKPAPGDGLVVQVLGKQFEWWFRYAGPDGKFGTEDDVQTLGDLHVPKDTNVTVLLRGQDVLHSFFVPALRLKQDTVPGMVVSQWFSCRQSTSEARALLEKSLIARGRTAEEAAQLAKAWNYEIACAELCGNGHTKMRGQLVIHDTVDDFYAWMDAKYLEDAEYGGANPDTPIYRFFPEVANALEDTWLRDNWPQSLKDAWPKDGE